MLRFFRQHTVIRRAAAAAFALLYAWSVLFVASDHTDFQCPAPGAAAVAAHHAGVHVSERQPPEECLACLWDQVAGHHLATTISLPELPAVVVHPDLPQQAIVPSLNVLLTSARAPPTA